MILARVSGNLSALTKRLVFLLQKISESTSLFYPLVYLVVFYFSPLSLDSHANDFCFGSVFGPDEQKGFMAFLVDTLYHGKQICLIITCGEALIFNWICIIIIFHIDLAHTFNHIQ